MKNAKYILLCFLGSFFFQEAAYGQLWEAVGNRLSTGFFSGCYSDTVNNRFFSFGSIQVYDSTGTGQPIGYHQVLELIGNQWYPVDTMGSSGRVQDMTWFKGHYYASGPFSSLGSSNQAYWAKYDNGKWNPMTGHPDGVTTKFKERKDTLYLGGAFFTVGHIYSPGFAKFDGTDFFGAEDTLTVDTINVPIVQDIVSYNGNWVIAGNYEVSSQTWLYDDLIIQRNGKNETPNNWQIGFNTQVYALAVYKNDLYVGGRFFKSDGVSLGNNIVKWDGSNWYELGSGCNEAVTSLHVFDGNLIVGGWFSKCDGIDAHQIAKWDGSRWCSFTNDTFDNTFWDIDTYHDSLFISGGFENFGADSATNIAKWAGGDSTYQCGPEHTFSTQPNKGFRSKKPSVFPNPTEGRVSIEWDDAISSISIFNMQGVMVRNFENSIRTIDFSGLPAGLYSLQLISGQQHYFYPLVKQ